MFIEMTIALLALACPPTKFENSSTYPWNENDIEILKSANKRCPEIYPGNKCVKLFRKTDKLSYQVICGVETPRE